jgi:hypothetical protein
MKMDDSALAFLVVYFILRTFILLYLRTYLCLESRRWILAEINGDWRSCFNNFEDVLYGFSCNTR